MQASYASAERAAAELLAEEEAAHAKADAKKAKKLRQKLKKHTKHQTSAPAEVGCNPLGAQSSAMLCMTCRSFLHVCVCGLHALCIESACASCEH